MTIGVPRAVVDKRKSQGRPPKEKGAPAGPDQYQRFLEAARELGCDPADPRISDVLRGMAARPHEPRRKGGGKGKAKDAGTRA